GGAAWTGVATGAPQWLRSWVPRAWFDRYAARVEESRLPKGEAARYALGEAIGADGFQLLDAVDGPAAPAWLSQVPAVEILRRVWLGPFFPPQGGGGWGGGEGVPPPGPPGGTPPHPPAPPRNNRSTTPTPSHRPPPP